jgi:glutathione peroxidase
MALTYSQTLTKLDGTTVNLSDYSGNTLLVVNMASHSGWTADQLASLQALHTAHSGSGLKIMAFPTGNYATATHTDGEEYATNAEIKSNLDANYTIGFDVFQKCDVLTTTNTWNVGTQSLDKVSHGRAQDSFWQEVIALVGATPDWSYNKYLIAPGGAQVTAFAPSDVLPNEYAYSPSYNWVDSGYNTIHHTVATMDDIEGASPSANQTVKITDADGAGHWKIIKYNGSGDYTTLGTAEGTSKWDNALAAYLAM